LKYLLDTNTCIYLLNGNQSLMNKIKEVGVHTLAIPVCVLSELYFGSYNSKKLQENIKRIELFKKNLTVLSDDEESARMFGEIKASLKMSGKIIEDFDIVIAAIALSNDLILVTNNTAHFERMKNLKTENWLQ
jgi:tRNA(fMet)-specific endonuclease VapC